MGPKWWPWVVFVALGVVRGTTPIVIQSATKYVSPAFMFVLRTPIVAVLYGVTIAVKAYREAPYRALMLRHARNGSSVFKVAVMGLLQVGLPFVLMAYALTTIASSVVAVLVSAVPLFSALFYQMLGPCGLRRPTDIPISRMEVLGMVLGMTGVAMVLAQNLESGNHLSQEHSKMLSLTHYGAAMLTVLLWATSPIYWKRVKGDIHYSFGGLGQNVFGGVLDLVIWLIQLRIGHPGGTDNHRDVDVFSDGNARFWVAMFYLSALSGFVASFALYYLFDALGPVTTNQVLYMVPVVAVLEDVFFNHIWSHVTGLFIFLQVAGMILVLAGLYLSDVGSRKAAEAAKAVTQAKEEKVDQLLSPLLDTPSESAAEERPDGAPTSVSLRPIGGAATTYTYLPSLDGDDAAAPAPTLTGAENEDDAL